jgi:alkylated DNA repair dioxygenase AlkB
VPRTCHQTSLLGLGEPAVAPDPSFVRTALDERAWIDVGRTFLLGSDALLDALIESVDWHQGRRWMYERMVDDPRLSRWYHHTEPTPHPVLDDARAALERRYGVALRGGPALNYYRDGRDSVAPHRDRELRVLDDTLVAILTLGTRRPFLLRHRNGGPSRDLAPGPGDLIVMGGSTQLDWEHAVPKVAVAGPRISVSWRWSHGPDAADTLLA